MDTAPQIDPPESISPEDSERVERYQYDTWKRHHFENAIKWDVIVIAEFLRLRCTEGTSGNENSDETDESECDRGLGHSRSSSIYSLSPKDGGSSPSSSIDPEDRFQNSDASSTVIGEGGSIQHTKADRQLSEDDRKNYDLGNLWNKALKPYFENWKQENHGTVLVKPIFEVKMHDKDVEIFSIFCALAAVLNIAPLNTPRNPYPFPPEELTEIQYQWLLATLLGKWVITIAAKFPTVFCVMSRRIGENTIYVCGTTKPKVPTASWPIADRKAMTESRHDLVDKAIGEHPLELRSLEFTHDENAAKRKLSSPLGAVEATEVKETTGLEELFQEIWRFSVIYKEGEKKRREEEYKQEEGQQGKQELEFPELEKKMKEEEKKRKEEEEKKKEKKKKERDEKLKKEKAARGPHWEENFRKMYSLVLGQNPGERSSKENKRKSLRKGKKSLVLGKSESPVPESEGKREISPSLDLRARKAVSTSNTRRRDEGQQRIGDCAEVWGLATLAGLKGSESPDGVQSTLISVSIDAMTIKRMKLANCIDHICLKTAPCKPACEGCTYLFNVVRFKSGTEAVDNMYGDGERYTHNGSSQCIRAGH